MTVQQEQEKSQRTFSEALQEQIEKWEKMLQEKQEHFTDLLQQEQRRNMDKTKEALDEVGVHTLTHIIRMSSYIL